MSKIEWSTIDIKHANKVKIIGDNGPIKIVIGGPTQDGNYWWTIKVEEKGEAATIEKARQAALDSVRYELEAMQSCHLVIPGTVIMCSEDGNYCSQKCMEKANEKNKVR